MMLPNSSPRKQPCTLILTIDCESGAEFQDTKELLLEEFLRYYKFSTKKYKFSKGKPMPERVIKKSSGRPKVKK